MKINLRVSLTCILGCMSLLTFYSCEKDEKRENEELTGRFEGKYKVVSAISDRAVDLDLNGSASSDLSIEIPNLRNAHLTLRLGTQTRDFIYSQSWPDQYVKEWDSIGNVPNITVHFAAPATVANFTVNLQQKEFKLFRDWPDSNFPLPLSVTVLPNNNLLVKMERSVYTSGKRITVKIEVEYQRFSTHL